MDSFRPDSAYWAQIAQAVYQDITLEDILQVLDRVLILVNGLRYLRPICRVRPEVVQKSLYVAANGLGWPDDRLRVWEENTAEYQALLGYSPPRHAAYHLANQDHSLPHRDSSAQTA
jgi:hypothetical protein